MRHARRGRPGFTLVEMLVVMALMIVLAALVVAVANSGFVDSQRVVGAADRASGWLLIAKQRAKRDSAPRGVRFFVNPTSDPLTPGYVTEAQYIEQPDPWVPNPQMASNPNGPRIVFMYSEVTAANNANVGRVNTQRVFFVSSGATAAADLAEFDQRVNVGEFLVLPEFGTSYRITATGTPTPAAGRVHDGAQNLTAANAREIALMVDATDPFSTHYFTYPNLGAGNSPPVNGPPQFHQGTYRTFEYAFQAAPRPLLGEPTLQLTGTTVIDVRPGMTETTTPRETTTGVAYQPSAAAPQFFDILFSPAGAVMNNPNSLIALWVRNPDKVPNPRYDAVTGNLDNQAQYDLAGDQVLVVVYPRTGLIATHPVNPPKNGADPYKFAKDGVNSGL